MQQQMIYYNPQDELDEELNINFKKIFLALNNRKLLMFIVFCLTLAFFICLTFVLPKKYVIEAELFINKAQNSNIADINPFVLEDETGGTLSMVADKAMNNELELIQSPLVIDKVIRENKLVYKKRWGIIPNKKEGEFLSTKAFINKNKFIKFENKKNTNVLQISYKTKNPEVGYNVVNSIIENYQELYRDINSEKSKSDKKIIEAEYKKAKAELDKKVNSASVLPAQSLGGTGNLSALSAFSTAAQRAIGTLKGEYVAGEKSRIDISEQASKVASLSSKLQWAKMVDEMSDATKVLVLREPAKLRDFEYSSPKLMLNVIIGGILGIILALLAAVAAEIFDKKLCYMKIGDNFVMELNKNFDDLKLLLLTNSDKNILMVMFDNLPPEVMHNLKSFKNVSFAKAEISQDFADSVNKAQELILCSKIRVTDAKLYKQVKKMTENKNILTEVLI